MKNQLRNNFIGQDSLKNPSEKDSIGNINAKKGLPRNQPQGGNDASTENPEQYPPAGGGISGSDNANSESEDITLDKAALQGLIQAGVAKEMRNAQQQFDSAKQELDQKLKEAEEEAKRLKEEADKLTQELKGERKQKNTLAQIYTDFGYTPPTPEDAASPNVYIAPLSMRSGMGGKDAVRECEKIYDAIPRANVLVKDTNQIHTQIDNRRLVEFIKEHKDTLRKGWEDALRSKGFLQGPTGYTSRNSSDAATSINDVPPAFWTYLSAAVRLEHSSKFVLWQFSNREIAVGIPPGQTTAVARVRHVDAGDSSSDWELEIGADPIGDTQPMKADSVSVKIKLNGMGKNTKIKPVSIPDFIMSYSLLDLEALLTQRLGYNYNLFEDIRHQELYFSTTKVLYNNNDEVVESPGSVIRGGQCTLDYFGSLRAKMSTDKVEPLDDGCYIHVGTPYSTAQLSKDLRKNNQHINEANTEEMTNLLVKATGNNDLGKVVGYIGKFGGFHCYETTSFGGGIPGTPGVQSENIAGGPKVTRSAIAMGVGAVGWATARPFQIMEDTSGSYGLNRKFIWTSDEGSDALDIDPAINPPLTNSQQLRVYEVRYTDQEIFNSNT